VEDQGLRWDGLGMILSQAMKEEDMDLLHQLYFRANRHSLIQWEVDVKQDRQYWNSLEPESIKENRLAVDLQRDGLAVVQDWGLSDELIDLLLEKSRRMFNRAQQTSFIPEENAWVSVASNGTVSTARLELPEIESLVTNETINQAVRSYLGPRAKLDGYKLFNFSTTKESAADSYVAGLWHHDRAGRRLKMFVFLHDVDCEEGHPTEVVLGSHNMVYYKTESMAFSRFSDDYIRNNYKIHKGCGKRGSGFLFDTHTIHKGTPEGTNWRTALMLEYHDSLKCSIAREMGYGLPCPSGDQYIVNRKI